MNARIVGATLGTLGLLSLVLAISDPFGHPDNRPVVAAATVPPRIARTRPTRPPELPRAPTQDPAVAGAATTQRRQGCGTTAASGRFVFEFTADGESRFALLQVPTSYRRDQPVALVLNFHGFGRTSEEQDAYSGLPLLAEREGFLLATPQGDGSPPGWDIPGIYNERGVDDVAFVEALVRELKTAYCIDEDRVYATGISNGAEMASLAACRLRGVFAAIAPVAGVVFPFCEAPGVAVIAFHGTDDFNIPFEIAPEAAQQWAAINACASYTAERISENIVARAWIECPGLEVLLFVVEGGGHTWPGAADDAGGVGATTHEIDANELMWAFFKAHRRVP